MTKEEYIKKHAPIFACCCSTRSPREECKRIKRICGCSTQEAVKTLIATFDEALKIRDKQTAITL